MKLTTHLLVVPRLRMREAIHILPQYVLMAWCLIKAQGQLCFFTFTLFYGTKSDTGFKVNTGQFIFEVPRMHFHFSFTCVQFMCFRPVKLKIRRLHSFL